MLLVVWGREKLFREVSDKKCYQSPTLRLIDIITIPFQSITLVIMEAEVNQLRQQLAEAEQNTVLAATYGKQLLEEKEKLEEKLEVLDTDWLLFICWEGEWRIVWGII